MDTPLAEQIQKRMAELPADIQQAIQSTDFDKKLQDIAAKYQLHVDQTGALEDEVLMMMMGFTDPPSFIKQVETEVGATPEIAAKITQDVSEQIFAPIRESMKQLYPSSKPGSASVPAPVAAPLMPPPASSAGPALSKLPPIPQTGTLPPQATPEPSPAPALPAAVPPATLTPKPGLAEAGMMLEQKTVTPGPVAPPAAPQTKPEPQPYSADPYREPPL